MPNKTLFLKWSIINLITVGIFVTSIIIGYGYLSSLNILGVLFIAAIALVYVASAIQAGRVSLMKDSRSALHETSAIVFWANQCPLIGLLGAVLGIAYSLNSNITHIDMQSASGILATVHNSMAGTGIALTPTAAGIFFCLSLTCQGFVLRHNISRKSEATL